MKPYMLELENRQLLSSVTISPEAQLFVYMLNRARNDPVAYQKERNLPIDLSYVTPRAPLAVNDALFGSAGFHAEEMATYNYFDHQSQVTGEWPNKMVRDAGYPLPEYFSDSANYIESAAAGYANAGAALDGLIVDSGISPPGHRNHLLGIDAFNADNREIGVGNAYSSSSSYGNYWAIHATRHDAADEFLTGVVYNDSNGNERYDLNEGFAGVTVSDGGTSTTTNAQGGWSLPITNGEYRVIASGSGFAGQAMVPVVVKGQSVEVDFLSGVPTGQEDFRTVPMQITPTPTPIPPPVIILTPTQRDMIFVTALYQNILGNAPSQASLNSWVGKLLGGTTNANQMATTLWNSAEHRTLVKRHKAPALSYNSAVSLALQTSQPVSMRQKDVVFVTTLYRDILGHNPKPPSLNSWVKRLLAGTSQNQVAMTIWNSPEHRTLVKRHGAPQISYGSALADASQAANNT